MISVASPLFLLQTSVAASRPSPIGTLFTAVRSSSISQEGGDAAPFPPIRVAKRVVLVRHGQSTWNEEGRIQGSSNFSVLTKKGEVQAETNRLMLLHDTFDACFASPLNRSKRTAEVIWGARKEEIITDSDLREIDLYSFQGLLKHEGKAKFGVAYLQWQKDPANFNIDGHYPVRELWTRARSCWTKILTHESRSLLVVAHNAVNQALVATAIGLGTEYFRTLLQSNCGTPSSPFAAGSSGGRSSRNQIILVCQGSSKRDCEDNSPAGDVSLDMLGIIQSQKTAELLLDLKVKTVVSSLTLASIETANSISRVQEAADVLGANSVPRCVEMKQMEDLDIRNDGVLTVVWEKSGKVWKLLLDELSGESETGNTVVAVADPAVHIALLGHCLNVTKEWMGSFHLHAGSISVLDFPEGPAGRGVIRCINYTAHLGRWSLPITRSILTD
ncbi:hypothetical protein RJ640_028955 [Escallonia rubra]|uniref:2-carboxy-D-arabinitol-1-phosphatase n=1 Tax=Escallonia rubra TaxID=112253 RepID=A0AA88RKF1_9ASTE|nr:hypothetical protein RJ640_028955 [Escallonia rubra]